jgi:DNA helicase-2/ATP-dependent DNA helicase PcrA
MRVAQMELTDGQKEVMRSIGPLLVIGGPGSGKTTISILKAARIARDELKPGQKILFLSFARATVSRVVEAIETEQDVPREDKRLIDVETYHAFFWRVLKTHGYLMGFPRKLELLAPPAEAIALSALRLKHPKKPATEEEKQHLLREENIYRLNLAKNEGQICFDLFAPSVATLLEGSERIRKLIGSMYPVIILDEFQDTNVDQWRVVKALGQTCRLIALADPEQRIYDWIGADPERLDHFRTTFGPQDIDLTDDNHRSTGTDIGKFGNDILTGCFRQRSYNGVEIVRYPPYPDPAMSKLVSEIYKARKRLFNKDGGNWSLAILVPTKKLTRQVSEALLKPPAGMQPIPHTASIEIEAAILGAEIIAFLMQPPEYQDHLEDLIALMVNFYRGKNGDKPTKSALEEANKLQTQFLDYRERAQRGHTIKANSPLVKTLSTLAHIRDEVEFSGNPHEDWKSVRNALETGKCKRLNEIAKETRNLRLLGRGTSFRQTLGEDWLENGSYLNALKITKEAFVREHFSSNSKPESGVVVMNMHKAKGKQFDEVIMFEKWPVKPKGQPAINTDRYVRGNSPDAVDSQSLQNFRVSVTRGKQKTTILTPGDGECVLLKGII